MSKQRLAKSFSSTIDDLTLLEGQVAFLDKFRLAILCKRQHNQTAELTVFNTLIPQHRPGNMRRLGLSRRSYGRHWTGRMSLDGDRPLGTPDRDEPLIADPTQALLVLELSIGRDPSVFLVIRTQVLLGLIDQTPSTCVSSSPVPWDEWMGDTVVIEVQVHDNHLRVFIHGAQAVFVWSHPVSEPNLRGTSSTVQIFDFSRRGRGSPQPPDGGRGGTESIVPLEGGRCFRFYPSDAGAGSDDELRSLGDGNFFYLVSCRPQFVGRGVIG